jgi:hypothetical protein
MIGKYSKDVMPFCSRRFLVVVAGDDAQHAVFDPVHGWFVVPEAVGKWCDIHVVIL